MRHQVVPGGRGRSPFFMTYPFGAAQTDLEQAFRLPDAPGLGETQKQKPAEFTDSELATVLLEHPDV